jgi:prepilin-type N-terminal cleavage/methylation domain-containing protein
MVRMNGHTALRRGMTLIEVLIATTLLLVVTSLAALVARRSLSTLTTLATLDTRAAALSDALATLHRHVAGAQPALGDIHAVHDTVLELSHTIGSTSACSIHGDTVTLPRTDDALPWSSSLPRLVTTDDRIRLWHERGQRWITRQVIATAPAAAACGDAMHPWPGVARQHLILDDSIPDAHPGAPVAVLQRERWSLVRGGDGRWSLSFATWDAAGATFAVPQPLVAPLASPRSADGPGLQVAASDRDGRPITDSTRQLTRFVTVRLRTERHPRAGLLSDSVRINVGIP